MNVNIDNIAVSKGDNVILLARPDGRPISLVSGDAVTADVVDIISSGLVMLRITPPVGKAEDAPGALLVARTNVRLSEGDRIALKVLSGDNKEVNLKLIGIESSPSETQPLIDGASASTADVSATSTPAPAVTVDTIAQKIQSLLTDLTDSRLTSSDFQALLKLLNNMPSNVKNSYPEFKQLAALMPNIEQLSTQTLKASIESSGVFFETNVKQSALQALDNVPDVVLAKNTLNSIVQKAVEAFQRPQTEEHTRSFLSDLTAVTYKGIQGLDVGNARQTLNMLSQAIDECINVVRQDVTQHSGCNCAALLTTVKGQLDAVLTAQAFPKDNAVSTAMGPGKPQPPVAESGPVVSTSAEQTTVDKPSSGISMKDAVIDLIKPLRTGGDDNAVVRVSDNQKPIDTQALPKAEIIDLVDAPLRTGGGEGPVMLASDKPQTLPKDDVVALTQQGNPQRAIGRPGELSNTVEQGPNDVSIPKIIPSIIIPENEALTTGTPAKPQRMAVNDTNFGVKQDRQNPDDMIISQSSSKDEVSITQSHAKDKTVSTQGIAKDEHIKAPLNMDADQKAMLLKIRNLLQDDTMADALKYSPTKREALVDMVDKFIKNIEYYQLTSRANDMVYTYLPFLWNELKDGELLFKKNKYHAKKSFTCDINLDLDRLGKVSISVTAADGGFFISFNAEKENTKHLISENRADLEKRFVAAGLAIKIINVGQKTKLEFAEKTPAGGLDLRI